MLFHQGEKLARGYARSSFDNAFPRAQAPSRRSQTERDDRVTTRRYRQPRRRQSSDRRFAGGPSGRERARYKERD